MRCSALAVLLSLTLPAVSFAAAGKNVTTDSLLLRRPGPGQAFEVVPEGGDVAAGQMLVGLPGAALVTSNGAAVRLNFLADLDDRALYPIREPAVILRETSGWDLDFTLDRGRVEIVNTAKAAVKVRIRCQGETWDVLLEPQSRLAAETYGRWMPGVPFRVEPKPNERPLADVVLLVVAGRAEVSGGGALWAMRAPPGPAFLHWNNETGHDGTALRLEKLPDWFTEDTEAEIYKARKRVLDRFTARVKEKGLEAALGEFLASDKELERRLAVLMMGATDDLVRLAAAIRDEKLPPDVWDAAVITIRHWIGRAPRQDQVLYKGMLAQGVKPAYAATQMQLLHSFGKDELARPETYEMLIAYLNHEQLGIRGLADWHLVRLVPAGKKIGYDPHDPPEKRLRAQKQWKELVPEGTVPPKPGAK
jgi:hypothetical protein